MDILHGVVSADEEDPGDLVDARVAVDAHGGDQPRRVMVAMAMAPLPRCCRIARRRRRGGGGGGGGSGGRPRGREVQVILQRVNIGTQGNDKSRSQSRSQS